MKCANCNSRIAIDETIYLYRSSDRLLVFCSSCEEKLKDRDAVLNFVDSKQNH